MEAFRPVKLPFSERFLGSNASEIRIPVSITANGGASDFDEGEVFWIGTDFSSPSTKRPPHSSGSIASLSSSSSAGSSPRVAPGKNFGILAALSEDDKPFLQRKSSILSSPSWIASGRMRTMPVVPRPKRELKHSHSMPTGRVNQQSAPINVPKVERKVEEVVVGDEDEEMLPPHEIVARASAKESPMTTFSVLEGVGRTLKGRDLRRVRNAVWLQTGFVD